MCCLLRLLGWGKSVADALDLQRDGDSVLVMVLSCPRQVLREGQASRQERQERRNE